MTNSTAPIQQPGINFLPGAGGAGAAPTPAPIHDIVGPLPFFTGPLWVIVAVVLAVAVAGGVLWWFAGRRNAKRLTPRETALRELERLRASLSEGSDHDFGVVVSGVLRRFLGDALGLAAPRQTTEEFLESLRGLLRFMPAEQEALAEFLHRSDYLKYAQGEATAEQREALIVAAESFVTSGEAPEKGSVAPPAIPRETPGKIPVNKQAP
jgi:hypothetical protein